MDQKWTDEVAQRFLSGGLRDFPVPNLCRLRKSRNWKVPWTRRLESLRHAALALRWFGACRPRRWSCAALRN